MCSKVRNYNFVPLSTVINHIIPLKYRALSYSYISIPLNHFLVKGSRYSEEAKLGLYPEGEQRLAINDAFTEYFKLLGAYLNSGL